MSVDVLHRGRRRACAVAIAASMVLTSIPGLAQTHSADREEERTALYRVGVAQADAGRWAEAVETFTKVIAIRSAPPALFTLGQAEEHLGHLVEADRTYHKAQADARAGANQDVASAAQKAITGVEARVPHLIVRLDRRGGASNAGEPSATVDGASVPLGTTTDVDPGDHDVVVRAVGAGPFSRKVHVVEGQTLDVAAVLEPEGGPPTPQAHPSQEQGAAFPLGPAILAGAGAIVGIAGYVVRVGGQSDYDKANAGCSGTRCPEQSLVDSGNSGRSRMIVGTATLGAGVAAVAGAGLWWVLSPSSTAGTQVGVALAPRDGGLRASFEGRF